MPPLDTGRMPEMEEDKETGETYKLPEEVVWTTPAVFKLLRVVEPVTVKVELNQAALAIVIPLDEALPRVGVIKVGEVAKTFCPVPVLVVTKRFPEAVVWMVPAVREDKVVEPVTVRVPVLVVVAKKE